VEVLACGEPHDLDALKDWLWEGPSLAEVTNVQCEAVQADSLPNGFTIGRSA
jgi:acylphosphatase